MRISHALLVITMAVFCSLATAASAECPLKPNETLIRTIDSVNPAEKISDCDEKQGNDCALFGVIKWINEVLPLECSAALKNDSLKTSTLLVRFKNDLGKVTVADLTTTVLAVNLYTGLGKLVIDGDIGDGERFRFRKNNKYQTLLKIICTVLGQKDEVMGCSENIKTAGLELRNLSFEKGNTALEIAGNDATFPSITIENVDSITQDNKGFFFNNLKIENIALTNVLHNASISTHSLHFFSVNLVEGLFQHLQITGDGQSATSTALHFPGGSQIGKLVIDDAQISGVAKGIRFFSTADKYQYTNVEILNSTVNATKYPIAFEASGGPLTISHVHTVGGDAGLYLRATSANQPLATVTIQQSGFDHASTGIRIEGNVQNVIAKHVLLVGKVGFDAIGISALALPNIPSPQGLAYPNTHFHNVTAPVFYESLNPQAHADGTYYESPGLVNAVNLGIDTPTSVKLFRDSKNLQWVQVELTHSEALEGATLYWVHDGYWAPMVVDAYAEENCQNGICTIRGATQFDPAHFLPAPAVAEDQAATLLYEKQSLEDLSVALVVASADNFSMVSESLSLLHPNWTDQEILTVDTAADDIALQQCTTKADDCSLRGAVALAKLKRAAPLNLTHPFVIRFAKELLQIPLSASLTLDVDTLTIDGGVGPEGVTPIQILPNTEGLTELLVMAGSDQTLDRVILNGSGLVPTALRSKGAANMVMRSTVLNTKGDAISVAQGDPKAQPPQRFQAIQSTFGIYGGGAVSVAKDHLVHLSKIQLLKTEPSMAPGSLVLGADPAPKFIASAALIYPPQPTMPITLTVYGETSPMVSTVYGYLQFSKHPAWEVLPIGTTEFVPIGDKKFKATFALPDITVSDLLQWGSMTIYMMGERVKNGEFVTTNLSSGMVVNVDFNKSDYDKDGVMDNVDNAPKDPNPQQEDTDQDGEGDAADMDLDGDGVNNPLDNCPAVKNADQLDVDSDGAGNACDEDDDADGVPDTLDNCPFDANAEQGTLLPVGGKCVKDLDQDSVPDDSDNCPGMANTDQLNSDGEGAGDLCDADDDNDGVADNEDNCPALANTGQTDADSDGAGDACDPHMPALPMTPMVDGAAPLLNGTDGDAKKPVVALDDSTSSPKQEPEPEPAANAESGGCTLMLR